MTVIGGLFLDDTHLLLSDVLLSRSTPTGSEMHALPMWRGGPLPSDLYAAGLVQKQHLFNEKLVLCWAGSPITARSFIQKIQDLLKIKPDPSEQEIGTVINPYRNGDIIFIMAMVQESGLWLVMSEKVTTAERVGAGTVCAGGTGREDLLYFLSAGDTGEYSEAGYTEVEPEIRPFFVGAHIDAKLAAVMFGGGYELENRWGGGYEITLRNENRFQKLDRTMYTYSLLSKNDKGKLTLDALPTITTKRYIGENLTISDYNLSTGEHLSHIIRPLVRGEPAQLEPPLSTLPDTDFLFALDLVFIAIPGPLEGRIIIVMQNRKIGERFLTALLKSNLKDAQIKRAIRKYQNGLLILIRRMYPAEV